jgi:hypothetical protein
MKKIPISEAKNFMETNGLTRVVIFGVYPDGSQCVATYGQTQQNAQEAARAGNKLKAHLGWPEDLCRSKPLKRICGNCAFYKPDYGIHCFNGWSGDGSEGYCMVESSTRVKRSTKDIACGHFEPKLEA